MERCACRSRERAPPRRTGAPGGVRRACKPGEATLASPRPHRKSATWSSREMASQPARSAFVDVRGMGGLRCGFDAGLLGQRVGHVRNDLQLDSPRIAVALRERVAEFGRRLAESGVVVF